MSDSANTHTHTHTYSLMYKTTHTQVMQGFLLTAPVPYRHHPLLLASNPGIKGGREAGEEWDSEEEHKERDPWY